VEQNGADVDEDLPDVSSSALTFRYPAAVSEFTRLSGREQAFKVARFLPCTDDECDCKGLEPPEEAEVRLVSREEVNEVDIQADEDDVRTKEGWWARCGRCGHGWGGDGHTWAKDVDRGERLRRSRVVGRIEEILQVSNTFMVVRYLADATGRGPSDDLPDAAA
jgi:histone acetyltransferase